MMMSETTTDLAGLLEQGRALLARDEIGRPVAIHGSGCPDDGTVNLWDTHETLLMDSMSEGEANEIAWWLNNGPALLDAAQSAQERAEAAERERDSARAENAALREALAWYADRGNWVPQDVGGFFPRSRAQLDDGTMARTALAAGEGRA